MRSEKCSLALSFRIPSIFPYTTNDDLQLSWHPEPCVGGSTDRYLLQTLDCGVKDNPTKLQEETTEESICF